MSVMLSFFIVTGCVHHPLAVAQPTPCQMVSPYNDLPAEQRMFMGLLGVGHLELIDCSLEDIDKLDLELGTWRLPSTRMSILQVNTIDSSELFLRADGVGEDVDLEPIVTAIAAGEGWSPPRAAEGGLRLPTGWGLAQLAPAPAWWDPPVDRGEQTVVTWPEEWSECSYPRGRGVVVLRLADRIYLHAFDLQHFFPYGGCGG
jgi:hypothetical protein